MAQILILGTEEFLSRNLIRQAKFELEDLGHSITATFNLPNNDQAKTWDLLISNLPELIEGIPLSEYAQLIEIETEGENPTLPSPAEITDYFTPNTSFPVFFNRVLLCLQTFTAMQALHNAQKQLRDSSSKDLLTGLNNRKTFFETTDIEQSRSRRFRRPLALLLLDIDHFNQINDRYGHDYGDAALQQVSRLLKQHCRLEDILCRTGNSEFAICSPDTTLQGAKLLAERIRDCIEGQPVQGDSGIETQLTISIGVTQLSDSDSDTSSIYSRASSLLKKAKHNGRNRVIAS